MVVNISIYIRCETSFEIWYVCSIIRVPKLSALFFQSRVSVNIALANTIVQRHRNLHVAHQKIKSMIVTRMGLGIFIPILLLSQREGFLSLSLMGDVRIYFLLNCQVFVLDRHVY